MFDIFIKTSGRMASRLNGLLLGFEPLIRIWQRRSILRAAIATLPIGIVSSSERLEAGILCSK